MEVLSDDLNGKQVEAVEHFEKAILVIAGPGTGKTKVITHRIAHLIRHHNVSPEQILAVTFTNKAANEMRERVENILGRSVAGWWLGTFHSLAARILRKHAELVNLKNNSVSYTHLTLPPIYSV